MPIQTCRYQGKATACQINIPEQDTRQEYVVKREVRARDALYRLCHTKKLQVQNQTFRCSRELLYHMSLSIFYKNHLRPQMSRTVFV